MKRISTLFLVLMALLALPFTASAEEVTFDFSDPNFRENIGEKMTDVKGFIYNETFTVNATTLQVTAGSAPSRIYVDANRGQNLVTYKEYTTLTFCAPAGYAITSIAFTAAGNSNINNFTASSGAIEGMTWTGNAEGVRFQQGGTSYLANAVVTLAAKNDATTALPAINYVECANIAAFNALEAGTYAKVTLTDAEVIGKSADGYSTVWLQDATGGCWIQYTSLNDKLQEGTKVSGTVYTVKRLTSGNPQMKEAETTVNSELNATAISEYTVTEGTLAEVNVAANLNKVVKITGATLEETSATAGKLTQGETTIDVNNGNETANQQLHKIADWTKDTKLENVTIVAILVAKSATANQLLPISIEEVATADATFDFASNPENWPVSTDMTDYETGKVTTLTVNDVKLTAIQNNEWVGNILYKADETSAPTFRVGKFNAFKLTAPEGKSLVKVEVTMATDGQTFDFEASNGAIADNVWTGNATEVTFTTANNRQIAKIDVMLADENEETIKPAAIDAEVANITDFNAIEDGKVVKLTLTNARVNGVKGGSYYVEDATGATVIKGIDLTVGTALNGYIIGTKSTDNNIDYMNNPAVAVEYQLTATDASTFEATATTLTGTVMTGAEACAQANYGRLITLENVAISGSGNNKTLTVDGTALSIKARDYMGVLPTGYTWPEKASKITGVVIYYMTGWFLMPISADAIEAATEVASLDGKLVIGKVFYAGSTRLNGVTPKNYMKHLYIELYNNSSETINVAGTYVAMANSDSNTAAWTAADMVDDKADCAVVKQIFQIPGTTVEMQPGKSLVITNCAVDHSEIAEGNVNLSDADFEVKSQNNAFNDHNESVPELTVVKTFGTTDFINFLNPGPDGIVLLPADTDINNCPTTYGKGKTSGNTYTIVPIKNSIDCVDIVKQKTPSADDKRFSETYDAGYTCTVDINTFNCQAVARKVVSTEAGRKVLKDTNNSSEDFETLSNVAPRVYGEGIVTGIQTINTAADTNAPAVIYNLQGVRMDQLQRGINIVNGKKIVLK